MIIKVSTDAALELEAAAIWYEKEQKGLGARLINAFENVVQLMKEPTPPWTPVQGRAKPLGAKKLVLHRFPFSVIAIELDQTITIVAFVHQSRKPGYWLKRMGASR